MTEQEIKTARDLQISFRDQLRELALEHYDLAQKAGLDTTAAAGIVAEECMHMSAFFVARGGSWNADMFAQECRKMFDWHKDVAAKDNRRPN